MTSKLLFMVLLSNLLICLPAKALIYKYTIRTNQNIIRMEVEHSRKKEIVLFDFNQAFNLRSKLENKQPFFVDEFDRLVTSLKKYQDIGFKTHKCSLFKSTDKTILDVYSNLEKINTILEKIGSSIILEEKYSASKQAKNILSDPMIYLPHLIFGAYQAKIIVDMDRQREVFLLGDDSVTDTSYSDYLLAFTIATPFGFVHPPHCLITNGFSTLIAYIRHR